MAACVVPLVRQFEYSTCRYREKVVCTLIHVQPLLTANDPQIRCRVQILFAMQESLKMKHSNLDGKNKQTSSTNMSLTPFVYLRSRMGQQR